MRPVGPVRQAFGWLLGFTAGAVWGVAFFSWGLPVPIPARVAITVLLILALAAASRAGRLASSAFALGMGASSATLLASGGLLVSEFGLLPLAALAIGVALVVTVLWSSDQQPVG